MLARFRSVSGLLFCVLIVGVGVILNWPVEYDSTTGQLVGSLANQHVESRSTSAWISPARIVMGGWPFTYYIANRFDHGPPAVHLAWSRFAVNMLVFGCAVLFFWIYERRANRANLSNTNLSNTNVDSNNFSNTNFSNTNVAGASGSPTGRTDYARRRFSVSDLVLLVSLVAVCFGYWQGLGSYVNSQNKSLRMRADQGLQAKLSAQLPAWVEKRFPGLNPVRFLRVRELELDQPDDETLSYALSLDTLQSLRIGGGTYDLKLLNSLRTLPLLTDLRVSGRQLNAEAVAAIASCKQLQSLNLMRTNITAEGVRALGEMPRLQFLNLVHTDVWLHELGRPAIANNLSVLLLPHREQGMSDELVLEDWNELVTLQIAEYDTLSNAQPVHLMLRRLPKLARLGLDQFQTFSLTLDEVPNLQSIEAIAHQATDRTRKRDPASGVVSLKSLSIRDSAIPKPLEINAADLHAIDIQSDRPVCLSFHQKNISGEITQSPSNLHARHHQKLLDLLGQCSAPMTLDLSRLDLREVDLGQFAKIKGLTSLTITHPPVYGDLDNLLRLSIRELDLRGGLMPEQVTEIIAGMPNLERLTIGWRTFDRMSMEGRKIKEIRFLSPLQLRNQMFLTSSQPGKTSPQAFAHLVDLPNLVADATYRDPLNKVHIENVPALTHLRFYHPLPSGSVIRGLKNLECFGGGGQELNDEHFDAIAVCKRLKTLCLLYSNVSSNKLKEIGGLEQLACLSVSGSQVTDEVLASWTNQKHLRTLRLKQTKVTAAGLRLIPSLFPRLERLTIDTPIDESTLNELVKCRNLSDFGIQGSTLSAAAIKKLQTLPSLTQLDLSECSLDAKAALALQQQFSGGNVKQLLLTNVRLVQADPQQPAAALPSSMATQINADEPNQFRVRLMNESQASVRFLRYGAQMREIWLDQDEVWDELFIPPAVTTK